MLNYHKQHVLDENEVEVFTILYTQRFLFLVSPSVF